MEAQPLSEDEARLIVLVRELKAYGFGEISISIQEGKVKTVKQTKTVKI